MTQAAELHVATSPTLVWDGTTDVLDKVSQLCRELDMAGISYCHWKSNEALHRSASGDNDLDLLVARCDVQRFTNLLNRLGFKEARLPAVRELPGVQHFYGLDESSGRLVHVHAQYQLIIGDDTTKNYRLPIEDAYLASAAPGLVFRVPAPEYELAVFVIRMMLKRATWDAIAYGRGRLNQTELQELGWLEERVNRAELERVVSESLPFVGWELWDRCRTCLSSSTTAMTRIRAGRRLIRALEAHGRRSPRRDTALRVTRRAAWGFRRYVLRQRTRKHLVGGGALIALVGGDGAGKSSAVAGLSSWLAAVFETHSVHMGKPPRSRTTLAIKGALIIGRHFGPFRNTRLPAWASSEDQVTAFPGHAWLMWHVLTARDRRREYARARRLASNGAIVVCDRFPLTQIRFMDGARTTHRPPSERHGRVGRWLVEYERRCYAEILRPEVLIVLRLEPQLAVRRRTDEDPEFVRIRSTEVWDADWENTGAYVIDASQPQPVVLEEIKALVWSRL
jgi:thymidylate kinase